MILSSTGPASPSSYIVICGQGLAGTLLAWALVKLGQQVLLFDEGATVTSSKIAAGLVTPISGKRLTVSDDMSLFLAEAWACYAEIAAVLGREHFHRRTQVRLFRNEEERARWSVQCRRAEVAAHLSPVVNQHANLRVEARLVRADQFHGEGTGFEMMTSGWLDTRAWLADSAAWFFGRGMLRTLTLEAGSMLAEGNGVRLPDGMRVAAVVFCEGQAARRNPWFPWIKWKCAKGEILTLKIPELEAETRIIHSGNWLLPVDGEGTFRTGSTYDWATLDTSPTPEGRALLEDRLRELLRVPWAVVGHEAAVRPIIHQSLARMGRHPVHPAFAFFNGLGSKGVLHGPRYARILAEHLTLGSPLPSEVDVASNG